MTPTGGGTNAHSHGARLAGAAKGSLKAPQVRQDQRPSRRSLVAVPDRLVSVADRLPDSSSTPTVNVAASLPDVCQTADPSGRATCTTTSGARYVLGPRY